MTLPTDLTDRDYWSGRQRVWYREHGLIPGPSGRARPEVPGFLRHIEAQLEDARGGRLLELGCVPGNISAGLALAHEFRPEGLDFSPEAGTYLETMQAAGIPDAVLHRCDLRDFDPPSRYDVVASFGLIEHFVDFEAVLDHHDRLLKPGGLCLVSVPHFRWVQWGYHVLFDRPDLRRHNLAAMRLEAFRGFAARHHHKILALGHRGRLAFFNVDLGGPPLLLWPRRVFSRLAREVAGRIGEVLPENNPLLAPFIVYLGRKAKTASGGGGMSGRS